jgi:hypothetical protein
MNTCTTCGRANEDSAQFCGGCGHPLSPVVSGGTATLPPPPPPAVQGTATAIPVPRTPRVRRFNFRLTPRTIVALLLIAVFVLVIGSLASPWWQISTTSGGNRDSISFLPGSMYNVTCAAQCGGFSAGSFPYSVLMGSLGGLYEGILVLLAVSAVLTGLAALMAGLNALGWRGAASTRFWVYLCSGIAALVQLGALIWAAAGQPGAFPAGSGFGAGASGSASPSSSFWGTNNAGSWGAGIGWYLALASVLLILVTIVLTMILSRTSLPVTEPRTRTATAPTLTASRGYTPPPIATSAARPSVTRQPIYNPPPAATPPPTPVPVATPEPVESQEMIPCSFCGTSNPARARTCAYCQRSLR